MSEIATVPVSDLSEQMHYAQAVAPAALLPAQYRGRPADILVAIGLGKAMGLSPAESLYRINVIQGKPTASAELIAANVRRSGHKLRVEGDDAHARAVIIRRDDPDYEFVSEWNLDRAHRMGLTKDNWVKQPGTMLKWRAITEVARLACSEALYGVIYTPEEMGHVTDPAARTHTSTYASPSVAGELVTDVSDAEVIPDEDAPQSHEQSRALHALFRELELDKDAALAACSDLLDRVVEKTGDLTYGETVTVLDGLATWTRPGPEADADADQEWREQAKDGQP